MDTPAERLRWARKRAGYDAPSDAAEAFGWVKSTYYGHENGDRNPSVEAATRYAKAFKVRWEWILKGEGRPELFGEPPRLVVDPVEAKTSLDYLASEQDDEGSGIPSSHEPNAVIGDRVRFPRRRLPVYGQAVAGEDGRFELNGQRIADVFCPPGLENVRDAYAVYVHGSSMEPRYFPGETVWVHPHKPVSRGDFVVAQIRNDEPGEAPLGFVKQFISRNSRELILEQFNPPEGQDRIMRFPSDQVISLHKIVFSGQS